MAFPQVWRVASATPGDYGDAFLHQWLLRWDVHALFTHPSALLSPNASWPHRDVLFYTDTLLPLAPVAGLVAVVGGWVTAFNVTYVLAWVTSMAATYLLARTLGLSTAAAVLAGLVFTFAGPHFSHYVHLQIAYAGVLPLALWLLIRVLRHRRWMDAGLLGVVAGLAPLISGYYSLLLGVALSTAVVVWAIAGSWDARTAGRLVVSVVIAAALFGPFAVGYHRVQQRADFRRAFVTDSFKARPGDFLAPTQNSLWLGALDRMANRQGRGSEHRLYPGLVAVVLGVVGAVSLRGRYRPELVLILFAAVIALALAFGRNQRLAGEVVPLPFSLLAHTVPGFDTARAISRFVLLPLLVLALLAGIGFDRVAARWPARTILLAWFIGALMLGEYAAVVPYAPRVDERTAKRVNLLLRSLPRGPVLELPMGDAHDRFVEPPRLVLSAIDWRPRVNGYSGNFREDYVKTVDVMEGLPAGGDEAASALARIDELRVRYLVLRVAPVNHRTRHHAPPPESRYDPAQVSAVISAIPPDRIAATRPAGAALLVVLTPRKG